MFKRFMAILMVAVMLMSSIPVIAEEDGAAPESVPAEGAIVVNVEEAPAAEEEPAQPEAQSEEEPEADEPEAEEPEAEEPEAEEPEADEPEAEEPEAEEPEADEPEAEEPEAEEPEAEEPEADEPEAEEPEAEEPEAEEPEAEEPEAEEPEADEPEAEEPEAEEPEADEPEAEEPEADEPEADEPEADEPEADEPDADEPEQDESADEPEQDESADEPEALSVYVIYSDLYGYVGQKNISFDISVSGGAAPYTIEVSDAIAEADEFAWAAEGSVSYTYVPTRAGKHEITIAVTDDNGEQAVTSFTVDVAGRDYGNDGDWLEIGRQQPLSGDWREDILAIASSQIGYEESDTDFIVEGGKKFGYSVYGAHFNCQYSDWCALFVEWVLETAGISRADFPRDHGVASWKSALGAAYEAAGSYQPAAGDLVFFGDGSSSTPIHMGIVAQASADAIAVIEGNSKDAVRLESYSLNDQAIVGFANTAYLMQKAEGVEDVTPPADPEDSTTVPEEDEAPVLAGRTAKTNTNAVNVRSKADSSSDRLAQVEKGTQFTIIDLITVAQKEWYVVEYNGREAYIRADLLTLDPVEPEADEPAEEPEQPEQPEEPEADEPEEEIPSVAGQIGQTNRDSVNVRAEANGRSDRIDQVEKGTQFEVLDLVSGSDADWYKVVYNNKEAYIRSDLLTLVAQDEEEPAEEPADEPSEEPADESADEPAEEPAEEPADESEEELFEEPAEEPADEPAEDPAKEILVVEKAAGPQVKSIWYDRGYETAPLQIHVTTDLDAQYLYMYMGDQLLATWNAADSNIDEYAAGKEWHVSHMLSQPGAYYLWYQTSADGVTMSAPFQPNPVTIERPALIGVWYDNAIEKAPLQIHVTTNLDMEHLYLYMGDTLLDSWTADEANITEYPSAACKEWYVTYTFDEPGPYYLWYKASADGVTMEPAFAQDDPVVIGRPALIGVWYEQGFEKEPLKMHVTTNLDMEHLYLYMGESVLASWSADEADITEYATCKDWNVEYTFNEPGPYYLWYKASKDGVTMEIPFSKDEPVVIERPAVIGVWYDHGVEKEPMGIHVTTNLAMQQLYLYMGEQLLASWNADEANITEYASSKDWDVSYTFDEPGPYYLWYKASDGQTESRPFSSPDPVVIDRPDFIGHSYGESFAGEPTEIKFTTNLNTQYIHMYQGDNEIVRWSVEDAEITEYATCKDWVVTYTFEGAGAYYLWYKASADGETVGLPFSPDPLIVAEAAVWAAPEWVGIEQTGEGELTLSWTMVEDAEGYLVYMATEENGEFLEYGDALGAENVTLVLTDLAAGSYWFKLCAYKTEDENRVLSEESEIQSIVLEGVALTYGDFEYAVNEEGTGIIIVRYLGSDAEVVVPNQIDDLPIVKIGDSAFEGNTTLEAITLPATVEVIGVRAFANCTSLMSMN